MCMAPAYFCMGGETSKTGMASRWPIPCGHWALACCLAQYPEASLCMVVEGKTGVNDTQQKTG